MRCARIGALFLQPVGIAATTRAATANSCNRRRNPCSPNARAAAANRRSHSAATNHPTAYVYAYHSNSTANNGAYAYSHSAVNAETHAAANNGAHTATYAYRRPQLRAAALRRAVH